MTQRISIDPITRLEGHGKIEIFLAELQRPMLERLLAARRNRSTLACLTDLDSRTQELWQPGAPSSLIGADASLLARVAGGDDKGNRQVASVGQADRPARQVDRGGALLRSPVQKD